MNRSSRNTYSPQQSRQSKALLLCKKTIEAGLFDDPQTQSALEAYAITGDESVYESILIQCQSAFRPRLKSLGFELPLTREQVDGEIKLGRIIDTDFDYCINVNDLNRHIFIAGQPGVGKTIFLKNLILQVINHNA